jgi:hypothetical protein
MAKIEKTIVLACRSGPTRVPVKKFIELHGIPGFAVHRSIDFFKAWDISHVSTGFRVNGLRQPTIKLAIQDAIERITGAMKGPKDTPEKVIKRAIRKASKKL